MLTSIFRALVNNLFKKKLDIILMENEKWCQNIFFFIKTFFNWIVNHYSKDGRMMDIIMSLISRIYIVSHY